VFHLESPFSALARSLAIVRTDYTVLQQHGMCAASQAREKLELWLEKGQFGGDSDRGRLFCVGVPPGGYPIKSPESTFYAFPAIKYPLEMGYSYP
jgi:hypothetical protein